MNLVAGAVNALFQFQPFFQFAAGRARNMIIERGAEIGYPWPPTLAKLRLHNWEDEIKQIRNKYIEYPEVSSLQQLMHYCFTRAPFLCVAVWRSERHCAERFRPL